jgi:hypothetical protein
MFLWLQWFIAILLAYQASILRPIDQPIPRYPGFVGWNR